MNKLPFFKILVQCKLITVLLINIAIAYANCQAVKRKYSRRLVCVHEENCTLNQITLVKSHFLKAEAMYVLPSIHR